MKVLVRSRTYPVSGRLLTHLERRLQFSLGRLSPRIRRVTAYLDDANGPRGGGDKVCRLGIRLHPTGSVIAEQTGTSMLAAIDLAADRAARSVARALGRARDWRRGASTSRRTWAEHLN